MRSLPPHVVQDRQAAHEVEICPLQDVDQEVLDRHGPGSLNGSKQQLKLKKIIILFIDIYLQQ